MHGLECAFLNRRELEILISLRRSDFQRIGALEDAAIVGNLRSEIYSPDE
jgi:hypothetical protein